MGASSSSPSPLTPRSTPADSSGRKLRPVPWCKTCADPPKTALAGSLPTSVAPHPRRSPSDPRWSPSDEEASDEGASDEGASDEDRGLPVRSEGPARAKRQDRRKRVLRGSEKRARAGLTQQLMLGTTTQLRAGVWGGEHMLPPYSTFRRVAQRVTFRGKIVAASRKIFDAVDGSASPKDFFQASQSWFLAFPAPFLLLEMDRHTLASVRLCRRGRRLHLAWHLGCAKTAHGTKRHTARSDTRHENHAGRGHAHPESSPRAPRLHLRKRKA